MRAIDEADTPCPKNGPTRYASGHGMATTRNDRPIYINARVVAAPIRGMSDEILGRTIDRICSAIENDPNNTASVELLNDLVDERNRRAVRVHNTPATPNTRDEDNLDREPTATSGAEASEPPVRPPSGCDHQSTACSEETQSQSTAAISPSAAGLAEPQRRL
jgi:hypothetical protein